jgi:DNA-binding response OmpR family regulator
VVLVVEDDSDIAALLGDFLEGAGFVSVHAADADQALDALSRGVHCILLDVMLPGRSGFELCRDIRASSDVPVLFLTARDGDSDKLRGLGLGADDYITKSATPAEIVARVEAVLRRARYAPAWHRSLRFDSLEIHPAARELVVAGKVVPTTQREFDLLYVLATHPRQVLSRDRLFQLVWGAYGDRSAVTVYIRRLREKVEPNPDDPTVIVTVWGAGYRFDAPAA